MEHSYRGFQILSGTYPDGSHCARYFREDGLPIVISGVPLQFRQTPGAQSEEQAFEDAKLEIDEFLGGSAAQDQAADRRRAISPE